MKLFKKAKRGFTLVELVVVIAVIAILAAVSVGAYFGVTESANSSRLEQEAKAAHTNIQLVAMNQDDNSNLTREGLYINDLDTFETKMESYSGFHYDIVAQEPSAVNNPTLYFCNETGVSSAKIVNQRFNTFKYYNPEVGNKRASVNIPSGDITIEEATFELGDPEPIVISSIEFAGIDDTVDNFFVGDRKTFNVITEPAGLGYTFEIGNEDVIKIEGNEIVAVGAGESKVTVRSQNLNSDGVQLTDEITVNVTALTAEELIVNNFSTNYVENTPIDADVTFELRLNNGKIINISNSEVMLSHNKAEFGLTSVKFSYSGAYGVVEKNIGITVAARTLESISANTQSIDTSSYFENDILDISNIKFTAHFNNDETEDITNSVTFEEKLSAGQEKITISYQDKTLDISFTKKIPAIELTELSASHVNGVPEYELGTPVTMDGWTITAKFNNGTIKTFNEIVDGLKIYPEGNLTATDTTICFGYSYNGGTEIKTDNLPINIKETKTFYFLDQYWWGQDGARPAMKLYNGDEVLSVEEHGTLMTVVPGTLSSITGKPNQVWKVTLDIHGATDFEIKRCNASGGYIDALTEKYSFEDLSDNNFLILTPNESWANNSAKATLQFDKFLENQENLENQTHRKLHLLGLNNDWTASDENELVFNTTTNTFTKQNVTLEKNRSFKFFMSNFGEYWFNFGSISISGCSDLTTDEYQNYVVGGDAAGVYNISFNNKAEVTFEKIVDFTNVYIVGSFTQKQWADGISRDTEFTSTDNTNYYLTVFMPLNAEFKVYDGNNYYNYFDNSSVKPYFDIYGKDNNIKCYLTGTYKFRIDLNSKTLYLIEVIEHAELVDGTLKLRGDFDGATDWSNGKTLKREESSSLYFFTVTFSENNEFKFYDGAWYGGSEIDIGGVNMYFEDTGNIKCKAGQGGTYKLAVNIEIKRLYLISKS